MNEIILGIDLGTTNSEVAFVKNGKVQILEMQNNSHLLPSIVGLSDDNCILVGESAANQYALYPERTIKSIKRHMGSDLLITLGENTYTPQEISAIIIKKLKEVAELELGETLHKAVITVPAFFSDAQRQATREAGEIAGLEIVRIINEPTAAALAYESDHHGRKHILVYDLGGGTFDVSVICLEDDIVEVLSSHGDNHLGGDDFDQLIIDHAVDHLKNEFSLDDNVFTPKVLSRIREAAESAKITLSNQPFARLDEEYLLNVNDKIIHLSLELSRHDYEIMITPLINQTLHAVHIALEDTNLNISDLDEILLVGGATRTPLINQQLEQKTGLQPRNEIDPDLCVASGAAIQGAIINGDKINSVLIDVTPYTFGTSALTELNGEIYPYTFVPLIRKNSSIPVSKTDVFFTAVDNQETVIVMVYQGEESEALNNTEIGKFNIEGLSKVPSGNEILTTFSLDLDGILKVSCIEKCTGKEASITIDNAFVHLDEVSMIQAKERINQLFNAQTEDSIIPSDSKNQLNLIKNQALFEKAEQLLEVTEEDDREDLVDSIEAMKDAITNDKNIEEATNQLSELIFYLES